MIHLYVRNNTYIDLLEEEFCDFILLE